MTKQELYALLVEACQHPLGAIVKTSDPNRLRQRLYAIRKTSSAFTHLSFVVPTKGAESRLFIIAKTGTSDAQG